MVNTNKFTPFEEELMIKTAASKGFRSVNEHKHYLMKQYPNWCSMLYNHYARAKCEGNERKNNELCPKMRRMLMADCQAVENDGGCLSFPDDSHLKYKSFTDEQIVKMTAELLGMPVDQFVPMKLKQLEMLKPKWFKFMN